MKWRDDTTLSDKAKEVAGAIEGDWRAVAHAVELCVLGTPIKIRGVEITCGEGDDLERRMNVLNAMLEATW
ncbi:MAG: hypothetical protein EHM35_00605 [Planctomycetaceae bacterium]|nr:MAG: hypothetical protein EHM35_00605 [Planctomycetaceae bacterium]